MTLEYTARAVGSYDSPDGKKVLVFRTICGRTVKVTCDPNQEDFALRELSIKEPA